MKGGQFCNSPIPGIDGPSDDSQHALTIRLAPSSGQPCSLPQHSRVFGASFRYHSTAMLARTTFWNAQKSILDGTGGL